MCKSFAMPLIQRLVRFEGTLSFPWRAKAPWPTSCRTALMIATLCISVPTISSAQSTEPTAEDPAHEFGVNVALSTDYLFRGISQTEGNPAISGGFDYAYNLVGFYAGVWASNVDFGNDDSIEIDSYGGFSGDLATGIGWDVGGLYYAYPGDDSDDDYIEAYGSLSYEFGGSFKPTVGVFVAWSPDFFAETGNSIYINPTLELSLPMGFALSVGYGYQDVDDLGDYSHASASLSKDVGIFTFDLTYNNNFGEDDFCDGADVCDDTVVFSISSSF